VKTRKLKLNAKYNDIQISKVEHDDIALVLLVNGSYVNLTREEATYLADGLRHFLGTNPFLKPLKKVK
jgi:hypothetical protein